MYISQGNAAAAQGLVEQLSRDRDSVLGLQMRLRVELASRQLAAAQATLSRLMAPAPQDNRLRLIKVQVDFAAACRAGTSGRRGSPGRWPM